MEVLVFDLKGEIGHFRRPDTTVTHASYPLITRTALWGLLGSILGLEQLRGENWIGIRLMSRVATVSQELSMLGKGWLGNGPEFNRPTSIELVVRPSYRIYYAGEHLDRLRDMISTGRSCYHTYLGSAYCLTFPRYVGTVDADELLPPYPQELTTYTVVPSQAIARLILQAGLQYGRVGGLQYEHLGEREFRGTINLIYEVCGQRYSFVTQPAPPTGTHPYRFCTLPEGEVICLW